MAEMMNMKEYAALTHEEREREYAAVREQWKGYKATGLKLNMARGKPGKEQLDVVSGIFFRMLEHDEYLSDGEDVRNYGELAGLPAARRLFADILDCKP
ncbi:MAG: aminotransferase, partial [Oscillospiraceae bacterium]|nr:aminotransferase [Oscillospiraceae bacterium]